jgi:tRNA(Ile)-lysidine synthetase-like protein
VIRRLAAGAGGRGAGPEAAHVERALSLLEGAGDRQVELRAGLVARRRAGRITVEPAGPRRPRRVERSAPPQAAIPGPGRHRLPAFGVTLVVRAGPGCEVAFPLVARLRRAGDRFRPARGRGSKTLKAWLIDRKVARDRRDGLLLLTDGTERVLAIPALGALAEGAAGLTIRVEPLP